MLDPSGSMAAELCLLPTCAEDPGNSDSPSGMLLSIILFKTKGTLSDIIIILLKTSGSKWLTAKKPKT